MILHQTLEHRSKNSQYCLIMEYNLASTGTQEQLLLQSQLLMLEEAGQSQPSFQLLFGAEPTKNRRKDG